MGSGPEEGKGRRNPYNQGRHSPHTRSRRSFHLSFPALMLALQYLLSSFLLVAGVVCLIYLLAFLELNLQPALKHLQVYQVFRAQFLKPYTLSKSGTIWPRYTNQLGNNLFQYSYARLRARYLGQRFAAGRLNQDVFHSDVTKAKDEKSLNGGATRGNKDILTAENQNPFTKSVPFEHLESRVDYTKNHRQYDTTARQKFLRDKPNAFAQKYCFYDQDAELIRSWMCPSVEKHPKEIDYAKKLGVESEETLVIHLRFAGAVEGWFADPTYHELPEYYYSDVIRRHGRCRKVVLVHEPKSIENAKKVSLQLEQMFPGVDIVLQCGSRCEDFCVMYKARNLALSVSTFAWWAGYLGARYKQTVFYPMHQKVAWYNPRRLKTWYNDLMPNENIYCPILYSTASNRQCRSRQISAV
ncbi:hypothetical protein AAMO2058_000656600 [Amorphochlora amoebiformis]